MSDWLEKVAEIQRLHDEALRHALVRDGCHKSSEGVVEITFGDAFARDFQPSVEPESVGVYSYVLGPSRMHYFDSVDEALSAVREWHRAEMEEAGDE